MWRLAMILAIEVVACIVLSIQAKAAGSLSFDEVMQLARSNSRLVKEIEEVMRTQKVKPTEISCEAGRFGNHWKYLGGGRSLPMGCTIGKRKLTIDGNIEFLDARDRVIVGGIDNPRAFAAARKSREKILTWEWNDN